VAAVYEDAGISGAKGRERRPGLDGALKDAVRGRFDVLMVWAVDRLGRSLPDLIGSMQELHGAKVDLFLHQQAIDTTTPAGRALFGMLSVFAEFERSMIVSRINAGIARVRETGKTKSGRPTGRPKISSKTEAAIRQRLDAGDGILKVARGLGVGSGTVQRVKRAMGAAHAS
jgi:DNA invertase Pin-like site-specific DNA recombinase